MALHWRSNRCLRISLPFKGFPSELQLALGIGLLVAHLACIASTTAQETDNQAVQQLDRLRREIREFEQRLSQSRDRERNLLGELEDCDREIALRSELMQKLDEERSRVQKQVDASSRELHLIKADLTQTRSDSQRTALQRGALADLVKRRAIYAYKHSRRDVLKALLTSGSLGQWLTRQEYLRRIAAADRANLLWLDQRNVQLASLGSQLSRRQIEENDRLERYRQAVAYRERLLAEENDEAQALKSRRADRENLLQRVRKDRELLAQQIEEKKQAAARVESLIKTLEAKREKRALPKPSPAASNVLELPFAQLKGRLNWPATGEIVARFGLQRHEKLSTLTENPGIDIAADEGSSVAAVCAGQVTKITWLRGYGNTVIIDHDDGYYTVYAHMGQIQVREGQDVKTGEILGQVGQSGSISGPRLHFEIWVQREKQDPLQWLAAK